MKYQPATASFLSLPRSLALVLLLLAGGLTSCEDVSCMAIVNTTDRADRHGAILFVGIGSGDMSGYRFDDTAFLGEDLVFRDEESWEAFWRVHKPHAPAPVVDFSREMVLASFMGVQGSGCNGPAITITGVERSGETLAVQVEETRGQSGCQRRSNPHDLVRCRRVDGPVDFLHEPPRPERGYRSLDHGSWTGYRAGDLTFEGEDLVTEDLVTFQALWSYPEADRDPAPRPRPAIDFERRDRPVTIERQHFLGGP